MTTIHYTRPEYQLESAPHVPRVTVCVTCYNHEAYIGQCLDSVLEQQADADLEILVGDDGSTDGTRAEIMRYAERAPGIVVPVFQENNLGASGNMQSLVARARGDYICHLDGDDYWLPGKLQRQLELLAQNPDAVAAYCNARVVKPGGEPIGIFNDLVPAEIGLDYLVKCGNFLNTSSLIYRHSAREALLSLPRDFIDYRVNIRLAAQGPLLFIDEPLVVYRWMVTNSYTSSGSDAIYQRYIEAVGDAVRLGAAQPAVDLCVRRLCRGIFYSSLFPPRPSRVAIYYRSLREAPGLEQGWGKLLFNLAVAVVQFPFVAIRHWRGQVAGHKVFYPTSQHRA